ncbi:methenyltetrahydrofolate synthase domain-containing protein isoform X1 [Sorex araneus]|uniref:methenyltetrahydrofolate synthase domain-containing protein isoform X1 n=2 Tax=Sorex araneus TaxID=42254 RepID=UPI002433E284|nr:methenyltetrahydrofolate synthase domain-containing protein isoform X1 [Sorex araneus]
MALGAERENLCTPAVRGARDTCASEGVSKQAIRQRVWDFMEARDLADFPRPVHGRIPNFKGSHLAAQHLRDLDIFASAQEVKVDPDKPLEGARLLALQSKKTLLVPTPRLRSGLFNRITPPPGATKAVLRTCATSQGVRSYSTPVGLDSRVRVDLLLVGSVAVSEKGWRIGKGEGYADLEYAMMVAMGAVSQETPVLTLVHDCQVLDFPEALLEDHDLTVDFILTPTRLLATGCARPKPRGITWAKVGQRQGRAGGTSVGRNRVRALKWLSLQIHADMLARIPVLRSLRDRERRAGKDVTLQTGSPQPTGAGRGRARRRPREGTERVLGASGSSCTAHAPAPRALGTSVPRTSLARRAAPPGEPAGTRDERAERA